MAATTANTATTTMVERAMAEQAEQAAQACDAASGAEAAVNAGASGAVACTGTSGAADNEMWVLCPSDIWWLVLYFIDQPSTDDYRKCAFIYISYCRRGIAMGLPAVFMSDRTLLEHGHFSYLARRLNNPRVGKYDPRFEWFSDPTKALLLNAAHRASLVNTTKEMLKEADSNVVYYELLEGFGGGLHATKAIVDHFLNNDPILKAPTDPNSGETVEFVAGYAGWIGNRDLVRRTLALMRNLPKEVTKGCCGTLLVEAARSRKLPLVAGVSDPEVTGGAPIIEWGLSVLSPGDRLLVATSLGDVDYAVNEARQLADEHPDLEFCHMYDSAQNLAMFNNMEDMLYALGATHGYWSRWNGYWPKGRPMWFVYADSRNSHIVHQELWRLSSEDILQVLNDIQKQDNILVDVDSCFGSAAENGSLNSMWAIREWARSNHPDSEKTMLAHGLALAAGRGQLNAMELCRKWGALVTDEVLISVCEYNHDNLTALCMVFEWSVEQEATFSPDTISQVRQWAWDNGCERTPWCPAHMCEGPSPDNSLKALLLWAQANGCPWAQVNKCLWTDARAHLATSKLATE